MVVQLREGVGGGAFYSFLLAVTPKCTRRREPITLCGGRTRRCVNNHVLCVPLPSCSRHSFPGGQTWYCCAIASVHLIHKVQQYACMCRCLLKSSGFKVDSLHLLQSQMAPSAECTNICLLIPPSQQSQGGWTVC